MKKSELSVGLRVEAANGQNGTVVDVGGWSRGDAGNWSTYRITDKNGRHIRVIGFVGGSGVVVVWDHGPVIDGMPAGSIESPSRLRPLGTFAAATAEGARVAALGLKAADEHRARLRGRYGDATDGLLADLGVPAEGPLDSLYFDAISTAIVCWDLLKGTSDA